MLSFVARPGFGELGYKGLSYVVPKIVRCFVLVLITPRAVELPPGFGTRVVPLPGLSFPFSLVSVLLVTESIPNLRL